jgi:hypothetical protein
VAYSRGKREDWGASVHRATFARPERRSLQELHAACQQRHNGWFYALHAADGGTRPRAAAT